MFYLQLQHGLDLDNILNFDMQVCNSHKFEKIGVNNTDVYCSDASLLSFDAASRIRRQEITTYVFAIQLLNHWLVSIMIEWFRGIALFLVNKHDIFFLVTHFTQVPHNNIRYLMLVVFVTRFQQLL